MSLELVRGFFSVAIYFLVLVSVLIYSARGAVVSNLVLFRSRRILDGSRRFDMHVAQFFLVLSVMAGVSTWYYVGGFFRETFLSVGQGDWLFWMEKSDLFVQAYRLVSDSPWQWFWSSQLLMAACFFVVFILMSGRKDAWAFILLGFLGAISAALALFLSDQIARRTLAWMKDPQDHPVRCREALESKVQRWVSWPIAGGLFSVMANSWIHPTSSLYMPNLIFLHVILLVPLIADKKLGRVDPQAWKNFLFVTAGIVAIYMGYQWSLVGLEAYSHGLGETVERLFAAVFVNDCQTSITLDLVFVTIATIVAAAWVLFTTSRERQSTGVKSLFWLILPIMVTAPVISLSLALPLFLNTAGEELDFLRITRRR